MMCWVKQIYEEDVTVNIKSFGMLFLQQLKKWFKVTKWFIR